MSKPRKGAKASADEEEAIVYGFLERQNRPYSVQNIVDALQKDGVKKTGTERALASLVSKGTVTQKAYGKVNIFILAQDKLELPDPEEAAMVDSEIKNLTAEVEELNSKLESLRTRASELESVLSVEQAQSESAKFDSLIESKKAKLADLGDGSKLMSKEEKNKLELAYYRLFSAWKTRKRMVKNIADIIGESSGMKPKDFYENVGAELDEDANVNIADFPDIRNPAKPARPGFGRPPKRQKVAA